MTWAGPPFVTDDPEPVAYQHWELYLASQHIEAADGWSGTAPHIELNYGVVTNVQLHLIPRRSPTMRRLAAACITVTATPNSV